MVVGRMPANLSFKRKSNFIKIVGIGLKTLQMLACRVILMKAAVHGQMHRRSRPESFDARPIEMGI